ncbi:Hypothetical protein PHPALM_1519, partial [Phytophthora palmivora]
MPTTKYKKYPHHVRACLLRVAKDDGDWKAIAELYNAAGAHVGAVPSGLTYQESQFSSFTGDLANEFIRRFLCHTDAEDVFDEEEFEDAEVLKLGPYSPKLNPIENVFSVYKSAVKQFLARQRPAILRVPDGTTITEHRAKYLKLAADPLFVEIVTPELCNR